MAKIDFDELENELGLIVPNCYRKFIHAVSENEFDLQKYRIYHTTQEVLRGNLYFREHLTDTNPKWDNHYFDFGVGDGCGNYFFLHATSVNDDLVELWSHDPPDIEEVSTGTEFFASLLAEVESGFTGPDKYRFQGNGYLFGGNDP